MGGRESLRKEQVRGEKKKSSGTWLNTLNSSHAEAPSSPQSHPSMAWLWEHSPWTSCMDIKWELVGNANSWTQGFESPEPSG